MREAKTCTSALLLREPPYAKCAVAPIVARMWEQWFADHGRECQILFFCDGSMSVKTPPGRCNVFARQRRALRVGILHAWMFPWRTKVRIVTLSYVFQTDRMSD
jgi:hypothetical protein